MSTSTILYKISRVTSTKAAVIKELDGMRFVAIFLVVFHHASEPFDINIHGGFGVTIFFVISGFILALPFAKKYSNSEMVNIKWFYLRRLTRLEPTYIIAITIWALIKLYTKDWGFETTLLHYLASITYTHYFIFGEPSTILFSSWSLEIEFQFYILAPFLSYIYILKHTNFRRILICMAIMICMLLNQFWASEFTIIGNLKYFLLGFLLLDIYLNNNMMSTIKVGTENIHPLFYDLFISLSFAIIFFILGNEVIFSISLLNDFLIIFLLFIIFYSAFNSLLWNMFLTNPWIYSIGGMCYSIYLFHRIGLEIIQEKILLGVMNIGNTSSSLFEMSFVLFASISITILICSILFVFLEKPFMKKNWHLSIVERWQKEKC